MRFLYPLLALGILAFVVITLFSSSGDSSPKETADAFIDAVRKGDYKATVDMFGGNTCRCPKKGGWVSYLVYASAQEPNLAFAMGRPFELVSDLKVTPVKHPGSDQLIVLPWQTPEDVVVDLEIAFDESKYLPMFLPLDMAFGIPITEEQFQDFLKDPDKDCAKAFSLRLRPSVASGAIERPAASRGIEYKPTEKLDQVNSDQSLSIEDKQKQLIKQKGLAEIPATKKEVENKKAEDEESDDSFIYANVEDAIRETLGEEVAMYLHPKDAGIVKRKDGSDMPIEEIENALPRLKSTKLRLHVVRREKLRRWTVYHFALIEPVLKLKDGTSLLLKSHTSPSGEAIPKPGPEDEK